MAFDGGQSMLVPLTEAQLGLWYAQRLDPANPIYNTGQYVVLRGPLAIDRFRAAVDQALAESDALAIRIVDHPDGPLQRIDEAGRPRLEITHLGTESEVLDRIRRDRTTPLDLTCDAPARQMLFSLGPQHFIWYQRLHHVVIDGFGTALLTQRICDLYSASEDSPPSKPLAPYEAILDEDAAYRASERRETDRLYWTKAFAEVPEVIGIAAGTALTAHGFHRVEAPLDPAFVAELQRQATAAAIPWPDMLIALVAAFIARHIAGPDVVLGVPTMGRLGSAGARAACMVMNVLPVHVAVDEDTPLAEFLASVSDRLREARRHGRYRSEQLRRDLNRLGGNRRLHGPLVNILPFDAPLHLAGVAAEFHQLGTGAVDDLTVTFRSDGLGNGLRLELDANPDLYAAPDVAALAHRLAHFLGAAIKADHLADVPTLTPDEQRWVATINATAHDVPDTTLTALIEATIAERPDAPALIFGGETLTYAELDRCTSALASRLRAAGVGRGAIVAVLLPRSFELVVTLVAILRAGAAYLPLDPGNPPNRLGRILQSAKPVCLVAANHEDWFPDDLPVLSPVANDDAVSEASFEPPRPEDAAYVIYTSGSTGDPKGVVIEHRAIVNRLEWMRVHYGIAADHRILQKTPATFDVSVWEFFLPLIAGATLVVAPPDAHKDPAWLARLLREERITTAHFVPSMLAAFLAEPAAAGLRMRRVFCSGEELSAGLRDRFHEVVAAELHNLYGPTEAAVDVSYWPASADDRSLPVPIGFPVWNTELYVLDERLRPLPPGIVGDLTIVGRQVAREYLHRPDLTADRFIADPFSKGRMYRTGDVARWRRDGAIEFLGRSDHQIKIRGLRVELGEIEQAVLRSGRVGQVVVIGREDRPGDMRIVAYLVAGGDRSLDIDALKADLAMRLPDYMVPSAFVELAELPVTRNGKLDRAALPAPERKNGGAGRSLRSLSSPEQALAQMFADVLGLPAERIGAEDDFFDLGGHSLLAAKLMLLVRERWQRDVGFGILFAHPTIERLAREIERQGDSKTISTDHGLGGIIRLVEGDAALPPLFCVHPAGGISWCYRELGRALNPQRPVWGLQASGLDPQAALPASLEELAADHVDRIAEIAPDAPVHLLGWSVGGIVAQAMAVELRRRGREVGVLAMLDSYPADCWRNEPEPDEGKALSAVLNMAGIDPTELDDAPLARLQVIALLKKSGHALGHLPDAAIDGVLRVVLGNNRFVRRHFHQRYDGPLFHFRATLDHILRDPNLWSLYLGEIEVHDIPSTHARLTGIDAVARIAPILSAILSRCDHKGTVWWRRPVSKERSRSSPALPTALAPPSHARLSRKAPASPASISSRLR